MRWLTLYAFSSENWSRSPSEVLDLTGLLRHYIRQEMADLKAEGVRLRVLGERTRFDADICADLAQAERDTAGNARLNLNVALSYGARAEIAAAARRAAEAVRAGTLDPAALDETGLAPERLELSIPESLVFSLEDDADIAFASLRDIGVNLLLDEFGHIFASLTALRAIPLTALKVDRVMLRGLPLDEDSLTVVRAIIDSSHALGLRVCADGVDTEAQRAILLKLAVDDGQGSVFSPPMAAVALRSYLLR